MGNLFNFQANQSQPFQIRNKTETKAEIVIYGSIGASWDGDGITVKQFSDELSKLPSSVKEVSIRLNSGGGSCFEGIAIYNRLKEFGKKNKAKMTVHIDGLAASIASIIALAGDEIIMGEGALLMVHLPWTWAMGNRKDLDSTVDLLLNIEEQMISIYSKKTGIDRNEIKVMLENETWMDADEALAKGFVDSKSEEEGLAIAASVFDSKWITKRPVNYKSQTAVVNQKILELKNRIKEKTARP